MAALTQDDLLAAIGRAIPDSYLDPIRDIGPGYELYQASAAVVERCSLAVERFDEDVHIATSAGGALATVPVTFYRATSAAGAGVMLSGTVVRASASGAIFRTTSDAAFGSSDLTAVTVGLAIGYGYEWNIRGPFADARGGSVPGELDTIDLPLQSPVFWDPSIRVRNDSDADGLGRPRTLDVLGGERSLIRQIGEGDANYRTRIRTLPDTVSPAAIRRQIANYFRRFPGIEWSLIETWQHEYQECYDAPDEPPTATENFNSTLFVYDDPRPPVPIRNRYLGNNDYSGAFIVEVQDPPFVHEFGFAYDDTDASGVPPHVATRALSAYDVSDSVSPPGFAPAYDGDDPSGDAGAQSMLLGLFNLLQQIKAAGVFVVIHIQES